MRSTHRLNNRMELSLDVKPMDMKNVIINMILLYYFFANRFVIFRLLASIRMINLLNVWPNWDKFKQWEDKTTWNNLKIFPCYRYLTRCQSRNITRLEISSDWKYIFYMNFQTSMWRIGDKKSVNWIKAVVIFESVFFLSSTPRKKSLVPFSYSLLTFPSTLNLPSDGAACSIWWYFSMWLPFFSRG